MSIRLSHHEAAKKPPTPEQVVLDRMAGALERIDTHLVTLLHLLAALADAVGPVERSPKKEDV